jgi:hypothetical protein
MGETGPIGPVIYRGWQAQEPEHDSRRQLILHERLVLWSKSGRAEKTARRRSRAAPREGMETILRPSVKFPEAISLDFELCDVHSTTFRIVQGIRVDSCGTDRRVHRVSIRTKNATRVGCSAATRAQDHQGDSSVFTEALVYRSSEHSTRCPALSRRCRLPNVACLWPQALLFGDASCITAHRTSRLVPRVSCGPPLAVELVCGRRVSEGSPCTLQSSARAGRRRYVRAGGSIQPAIASSYTLCRISDGGAQSVVIIIPFVPRRLSFACLLPNKILLRTGTVDAPAWHC